MVLVTGANSLLGVNTVVELLNNGYKVKGLVRNPHVFPLAKHPNLYLTEGDINKPESIQDAIAECDTVIHIAAITDQHFTSYAPYYKTNVLATQLLIENAIRHKVKQFIYVSTANAIGYGTALSPGNEEMPPRKPFTTSHYAKSKIQAQQYVLNVAKESRDMKICIVNPTFMLGKYDTKPSSGKIIVMAKNKRIVLVPPGGKNFIHVADVAKCIVNALILGQHGEKYVLAGENLSYHQFYTKLNDITGTKQLLITVPKYLLYSIGAIGSMLRLMGIKTPLSLTNMRILCTNNYYSNAKAVQKLNLQQTTIDKAILDAVCWFEKNNY